MSELDQLRQEAEQLKNQIRVRSRTRVQFTHHLIECMSGQMLPGVGGMSYRVTPGFRTEVES